MNSWVQKLRVLKWFSASYRFSAIQEGTVLYGLKDSSPGHRKGFPGRNPFAKELQCETLWVPFPWFSPELSPWNPFQQPCHGSMWDRPRGEGWWTSSVQWDCTKSIQMISLASNPASKDPFRCPAKTIPGIISIWFFFLKKNRAQLAASFSCLSGSKYHKFGAEQCFYFY